MFVSVADYPGVGRAIRVGSGVREIEELERIAKGLADFATSLEEAVTTPFRDTAETSALAELAVDAATASAAITILTQKFRKGRKSSASEHELADGVGQDLIDTELRDELNIQGPVNAREILERLLG